MIENLWRVAWMVAGGGLAWALAVVLDRLHDGEPDVQRPWREAKIRNGFLIPVALLWAFKPMGPISFEVVCWAYAILLVTVIADLRGWAWRPADLRTAVRAEAP